MTQVDYAHDVIAEDIEPRALAPTQETAAIISVIERAALNPDVDIDKMERLLQMHERILDRNARAAYNEALSTMQPKLPVIGERGKISTDRNDPKKVQSTYALWEDINQAIGPVLAEHGFALSFRTGSTTEGKITVTGILSHRAGHQEETTLALPHDSSGSKNAVQAVGSSTSYGKRYTAQALLNLTSRGDDDDGQKGGAPGTITEDQADDLRALMEEVKADPGRFLTYLKVGAIADIPAARYKDAVAALEAKRVKQ